MVLVRQYQITQSIVDLIYIGTRYTDARREIRRKFSICESTFVKYWKKAQWQHYYNCKEVKEKVLESLVLELSEYKKRYGDL
ncbi:hypothetical protein [Flavobacterium xanthum]|uniref:Uncharacterized protein n=1 Tax=Flavobacterium xanthum TaxID=69322 RepID=A0A1M6XA74_9FLAO|nr:hypothetical protein [Flavobacterium xanthum]SHL02890.1 hypothetical protein SAMN05443669_1001186 [Flavobacterium xanthum]